MWAKLVCECTQSNAILFLSMEKTEPTDWETCRSTFNFSVEIRINILKDDKKVPRFKTMKLKHCNQRFKFRFLVSIFPNGVDAETDGWLVVLADMRVPKHEPRPRDYGILSCTVSVIDVEGKSRLPRSFVEIPFEEEEGERLPRYLERSAILDRKDEFLSGNILTLCCDIHFYLNTIFREGLIHRTLKDFLRPIPQGFYYRDESQTEDLRDAPHKDLSDAPKKDLSDAPQKDMSDAFQKDLSNAPLKDLRDAPKKDMSGAFTIIDFTHQILTLPPLHELRRRFGVRGNPVSLTSVSSPSTEDNVADIVENVWMFDTDTVRFLLSLDEQQDSVGVRLLKSSPVIRRMANTDMKERRDKRIPFPDVTSRTFIIVLYFLDKETLPASENRDFLDVYRFAHFHGMGSLQRKCSEAMVKSPVFPTRELKRTADKYSDRYLSKLLESRRLDYETEEQPRFKVDDRPDFHCYI